jgi:hypothetical protein
MCCLEKILGKQACRHITSLKISKDTLRLYVDSSVWYFQFSLLKSKLLSQMQLEQKTIKYISIKLS